MYIYLYAHIYIQEYVYKCAKVFMCVCMHHLHVEARGKLCGVDFLWPPLHDF